MSDGVVYIFMVIGIAIGVGMIVYGDGTRHGGRRSSTVLQDWETETDAGTSTKDIGWMIVVILSLSILISIFN